MEGGYMAYEYKMTGKGRVEREMSFNDETI